MKEKTISKDNVPHYVWGNACDSWVLLNTTGLSVKQERMPPGASEQLHFHTMAQQFFFVLKGEAVFYVEGERQGVKGEEGRWVKPDAAHFIKNEGVEDLHFLVISQPATDGDRTLVQEESRKQNIHS